MIRSAYSKATSIVGICAAIWLTAASASEFNIPASDLKSALDAYAKQAGVALMYPDDEVKGSYSKGAKGDFSADVALSRILSGTGFKIRRDQSGALGVVHDDHARDNSGLAGAPTQLAATAAAPAALETVTVTSSKIGGDVQNIPISITALSQEQLTATQTAGGPDLIKQVPNMTFTKTNFSGYSIQLRGIGTQAISVTTDPAVAVAFNDMPFIRNHFFEQEFYDVGQVEVLRGPQGTLYGRNATAGVVNLISAKPTDQFEAMASVDIGNYQQRRMEGMINVPIADDRLDVRLAGEWTKRQGYSFNDLTDQRIDGRDLWSSRLTIGWKPSEKLQTYLIWEHFSEDDDRIRSSKQLCKTDPTPTELGGVSLLPYIANNAFSPINALSQGCSPASLYSSESYEVPNGFSLPYVSVLGNFGYLTSGVDPYASTRQSSNLRVIESTLNPTYKVKNNIVEFNADYTLSPQLTLTSQTGYNQDFLYSLEDYNRFNTSSGIFNSSGTAAGGGGSSQPLPGQIQPDGVFCDPQLGCTNRLVGEDQSNERAWQLSQEFRLSSNFQGPLNFSAGGNYLHYDTVEDYYVFINALTIYAFNSQTNDQLVTGPYASQYMWKPGVTDDSQCLEGSLRYPNLGPNSNDGYPTIACPYIDPNPIQSINGNGHNYFRSENPYTLNSYAAFGEVNYELANDLKIITGVRWTEDRKHFVQIPSELLIGAWGYPVRGSVNQQWDQVTGRFVANWTPKLDFTDQTLVYASYSHGYKAGGANPPGALLLSFSEVPTSPAHPLTFKPEFVDAFELGTKNTLLDGALTLNGDVFYYNYENYQISQIVDRTSINLNFDAHVKGAELEAAWEPVPGLRFNFAGGWEETALAKGQSAIDLMDRTAGNPNWVVLKPFLTNASNCIIPTYVVLANPTLIWSATVIPGFFSACDFAYADHLDPITNLPYVPNPTVSGFQYFPTVPAGYIGFDPSTAPNGGAGFAKNVGGNQLPNAPPFTISFGTQYTIPLSTDWASTLRGDFYWQDNSWARVWNDNPYDRLHGYTNLNLTLIFTNQNGWQVMLYDKNVFNTTAITGAFLNSDDSGLTTNVFLTDPKLIGVRVTKNW